MRSFKFIKLIILVFFLVKLTILLASDHSLENKKKRDEVEAVAKTKKDEAVSTAVKEYYTRYLSRDASSSEIAFWVRNAKGTAHLRHSVRYSEEAKEKLFEKMLSTCKVLPEFLYNPNEKKLKFETFKKLGMCREEIIDVISCEQFVEVISKDYFIGRNESTCEEVDRRVAMVCDEDLPYNPANRICYHFAYDFHKRCQEEGKECLTLGIACKGVGHLTNAVWIRARGWCVIEPQNGIISSVCVNDPAKITLDMVHETMQITTKKGACIKIDRKSKEPIVPGK